MSVPSLPDPRVEAAAKAMWVQATPRAQHLPTPDLLWYDNPADQALFRIIASTALDAADRVAGRERETALRSALAALVEKFSSTQTTYGAERLLLDARILFSSELAAARVALKAETSHH